MPRRAPRSPLDPAWDLVRAALDPARAREVVAALPPAPRAVVVDGAGGLDAAAELLVAHAAEAFVAERLLRREPGGDALARAIRTRPDSAGLDSHDPDSAGPDPAGPDPAGTLLAPAPGGLAAAVDVALPAGPIEADLWPRSFSARARKRRGGVYTEDALIDLLLDLSGWSGSGALLEPAAGAGAFLLRAFERGLEAGHPPADLAARLVGNDVHPFACRAARTGLALAAARRGLGPEALPRVTLGDALTDGPDGAPASVPIDVPGGAPAGAAAEGGWDLIVGNPPWVRGERIPAARRAAYRSRFPDLGQGNVDLACYFVAHALGALRPGGRLAFVLPQGLFEARSAAGLRALLAERTLEALVGLEWAPPQFAQATVIPCLLVVRNEAPAPDHAVRLGQAVPPDTLHDGTLRVRWTRIPQRSWLDLARGPWPLHLRDGDLPLLRRLARAPTPLSAGYGLAVRTRARAGSLIAEGPAPAHFQAPRPLIDGREVRPWAIDYAGRVIDYRTDLISDPKSEAFFAGPKVVVPRIALTVTAAVDDDQPDGPLLARNTVMVVRAPGTLLDAEPHALAALLNSLPVRAYAFHLLRAGVLASSHRATLYARLLGDLPVPARLLEDRPAVDHLAGLARRARSLAVAGLPDALGEVEAQIDAAVAEAFGLSLAQLAGLRARAAQEPLRRVLSPPAAGSRTRRIAVADYAAGQRYR